MKKSTNKHTVKLRKKQPDFIGYLLLLLRGALPLIACLLFSKVFNLFNEIGISISIPPILIYGSVALFVSHTLFIWYISPITFSKNQRIRNTFRKIIELNNFYYEIKELNKITHSIEFKYYWFESSLYIEVYTHGGSFTNKMNDLTPILQTALNLTVVSVQDDFADHTTYILTNTTNNYINATNLWD